MVSFDVIEYPPSGHFRARQHTTFNLLMTLDSARRPSEQTKHQRVCRDSRYNPCNEGYSKAQPRPIIIGRTMKSASDGTTSHRMDSAKSAT